MTSGDRQTIAARGVTSGDRQDIAAGGVTSGDRQNGYLHVLITAMGQSHCPT